MDNKKTQLGFIHRFIPSKENGGGGEPKGKSPSTILLLLHGTGGNEEDMVPLGNEIAPGAAILSPRGKVLENGVMPRFFRRLAEGVFDIEDLKFRSHELVDFVKAASSVYRFDLKNIVAVGYSNGANIAASVILLHPDLLSAAILFRPMVPFIPDRLPDLSGSKVFMSAGSEDPIVPRRETQKLYSLLNEDAGADVSLYWQNAGHELVQEEIQMAKEWLYSIKRKNK